MSRRKSKVEYDAICVRIPKSLSVEVKTLLLDPSVGRTKYGAFKNLINMLMLEWLEDVRAGRRPLPNTLGEE